jgi:hypothetical protein
MSIGGVVLVFFALAVFEVVVVGVAKMYNESEPSMSGEASPGHALRAEPSTHPISTTAFAFVTAAQLRREYRDNSVAADERYAGNTVRVDGSISRMNRDFWGDVVLYLSAGDDFNPVMATVSEVDTEKAAALGKGQQVMLVCKGKTRMGSAALEECRIQ